MGRPGFRYVAGLLIGSGSSKDSLIACRGMQEWRKRKQNKAIGSDGKILPDREHVNNPFMRRLPFDVQIFHPRAGFSVISAASS
jgi:hypothetical protein